MMSMTSIEHVFYTKMFVLAYKHGRHILRLIIVYIHYASLLV